MEASHLHDFIRAHASMSDAMTEAIARRFTPVAMAQGDYLLRAGEVNDRYLVVDRGWLRSFTLDTDGNEVSTAFSGPSSAVFDVDSFFMRTPAEESIVAMTEVSGAEISFAGLNTLFHAHPEFREMGRMVLVRGFVALKQRMLSMIKLSAEERYTRLMRSRPELLQHVPLKHIASYLGVTDTSLSRIRREFVRS